MAKLMWTQVYTKVVQVFYPPEVEFHTNEFVAVREEPSALRIGSAVLTKVGRSAFDWASRVLAFEVKFTADLKNNKTCIKQKANYQYV